ncbi:MAG: diguanylate cyclase [Dechloromonas sp.]|nr:diguanylate cyclase [Dechloromonas sp.]
MPVLPRILIVDDSRVVRASLVQHLQGQYEIREASDGEAAWQALVLDPALQAVISDLQMPKMNGDALLERLRASKLRRLQQMPFLMISGEESDDERARLLTRGDADFISKSAGAAEVRVRLGRMLALVSARDGLAQAQQERVQDPETGLYSRRYLELQAAQALSHAARHGGELSVLLIGFDHFSSLVERLGQGAADAVTQRFARMLAGRMRHEDSLGQFTAGQYAIVSSGTAAGLGARFAERVRQAVETARLSHQGQAVALTVSIGLASVANDHVTSAGALLQLAEQRMQQAMQAGGNRVNTAGVEAVARALRPEQALALLVAGQEAAVRPHAQALLGQLLPLLALLDQELNLALPSACLENDFGERNSK